MTQFSIALRAIAPRNDIHRHFKWVAVDGNLFPGVALPDGSFAALGTGGHFVLVIPAFDTVIVHRMESETNRQVWSLSRDYFRRFLKVLLAAKDIP